MSLASYSDVDLDFLTTGFAVMSSRSSVGSYRDRGRQRIFFRLGRSEWFSAHSDGGGLNSSQYPPRFVWIGRVGCG